MFFTSKTLLIDVNIIMKVAGFTFIRNAVKNDYPIVQAILSILDLCDEFIVVVGNSADGTRKLIEDINSPKIRIIDSIWDGSLRAGGKVFAVETDKAFAAISKDVDWAFYIQGDEVVHEDHLPIIKKEMEIALGNQKIEGFLFNYLHFYGSYSYLTDARKWYRREVRIVRRSLNVKSFKDAQGFRIDNRKIRVKLIDAFIYHYGWVKPPKGLVEKGQNFSYFYDENVVKTEVPETASFDYGNAVNLKVYNGSQPKVMQPRINRSNWNFDINVKRPQTHSFRQRILQKIYEITGLRIGEYKNYVRVE
jgi:hypothetical protein